ncbi:MAG: hypothetical protein QF388_02520, partial [Acidimicrobiales bacterium]|nr:hypothetical protein [Acidimicrobiales bacterium]
MKPIRNMQRNSHKSSFRRNSKRRSLWAIRAVIFTVLATLPVAFTQSAVFAEGEGFTIAETSGNTAVSESGSSDTFTIVLDTQPTSDVTFSVSDGSSDEISLSPTTTTFTNANWDTPQTVTVTGSDDNLVDGSQTSTVTISVVDEISDDDYDSVADKTLSVSTSDNDTAGFTVAESSGSTEVAETGSTDTFTVVLDAEPTSNVVIDISSGDTGEATVTSSLTFTSANWDTAQTVTVTGVNDDLVDGTQTTTITLTINDGSSDNDFDGVNDQTVSATTTDDDTAGFTITTSGGSTTVAETGSTDTFTVVLDAEPTSNVVISVTSADTGEVTVVPTTLTFTSVNWNTAQTVTVTGVDDGLVDGSQTTNITLSVVDASSDDDFDGVNDQNTPIETTDDDSVGFTLVESSGSS